MAREDTVTMSAKELRWVHVLRQVQDKRITQREAGTLLGLTNRQIRCLLRRVEQEGDRGWSIEDAGSHRTGGFPRRRR